jgi:hypothetical protein
MASERFGDLVEKIICAHVRTGRILALGAFTGALLGFLSGLTLAGMLAAVSGAVWPQVGSASAPMSLRIPGYGALDLTGPAALALALLAALVTTGALAGMAAALAHRQAVRASGLSAPGVAGMVLNAFLGWLRGRGDAAAVLAFDLTSVPPLALGVRVAGPDLPWLWVLLGSFALSTVIGTLLAFAWLALYERLLAACSGVDWVGIMNRQVRERYGDDWVRYNAQLAQDLREAARRRAGRGHGDERSG